jgi:hypothetical protein
MARLGVLAVAKVDTALARRLDMAYTASDKGYKEAGRTRRGAAMARREWKKEIRRG